LADLLENHPEMKQPYAGADSALSFMCHDRASFAATVKAFGKGEKSESVGAFETIDFVPDFPLNVIVHGFKYNICEKRTTKRLVPEQVIPATPAREATPECVIPAHEEEVTEYVCGPILVTAEEISKAMEVES
jgi:hypothetical protein